MSGAPSGSRGLPINQTLTHERLPLEDGGFVRVPTAPGIGVTLDDEVVERYRVN